jgi:hypothetical protein
LSFISNLLLDMKCCIICWQSCWWINITELPLSDFTIMALLIVSLSLMDRNVSCSPFALCFVWLHCFVVCKGAVCLSLLRVVWFLFLCS